MCCPIVSAAVVSSLQPLSIPPTGSVILLKCQTNSSQWMNPATLAAHTQNKTYKLPSISPQKKSILDPSLNVNVHRLPTYSDITQDKLTPAWQTVVPIKEPENPGCQGEQILMPVMVRIRRRKMKTHKYKKMRKRLAFLLKRRREAKKKKQRKALELYRSKWMKMADEFDAEKFVSESISKAKEQNWSVDVVQDWYKSKSKAGA